MKTRIWIRKLPVLVLLIFTAFAGFALATPEEDYQKRVERADLEKNPKQHRSLATWCARNFPEKAEYHQNAYNEYEFSLLEARLPTTPEAADFKRMSSEARSLGLAERSQEYLAKWGELQFDIHAQRLVPGDVEKRKLLLKWCVDEKIAFIPAARKLAEEVIELEPTNELARSALGHLEIDGKWQTLDEVLSSIDLRDPLARLGIHRKLAQIPKGSPPNYPANPFKGMEQDGNLYLTSTAASKGEAKYFLSEMKYSRTKPASLIISLHGGGSGGYEKARYGAAIAAREWSQRGLKGGSVAISPIARKHVTNSWGTLSNVEDLIDAIEETLERFNIDRKRIYVTGQSMGGGGTSLYYLCLPEMAAAYCARAGFYFRDRAARDVLAKPILIIHGDQDEGFRNASRDDVVKQILAIGGDLTDVRLPDSDHFIGIGNISPKMLPYFESHTNDIEPDFRVIRAAARKWFKN